MDESEPTASAALFPPSVGERLRAAREAAKLDLNDIATKTRVPLRHLEAIERGDVGALPSPTYAIGFARSYARAAGLDDRDIAHDMRIELGRAPLDTDEAQPYEPVDPARLPSRLLAWTAAILAVVLAGGYLFWRTQYYGAAEPAPTDVSVPAETVQAPSASVAPPQPAAAPSGEVVLTATAPVWLRVYDRSDKVLLQKEMTAGERFAVPVDADTPMVRTGRPDALQVTVGGAPVAPLGPPERTVRDVVLTAAALAARPAPAPLPGTVPTANGSAPAAPPTG
jgi:cytoskeleton protein RodZ